MRTRDRIIGKYLEADSEKRLYLFLDCPSLRNEFIEIDLSEYRSDTAMKKTETAPVRSFLRWWRTTAASCCLIFKKA